MNLKPGSAATRHQPAHPRTHGQESMTNRLQTCGPDVMKLGTNVISSATFKASSGKLDQKAFSEAA
jgi:hypothetical protein